MLIVDKKLSNKLAKLVGVQDEEQMDKMVEDYYNV